MNYSFISFKVEDVVSSFSKNLYPSEPLLYVTRNDNIASLFEKS